MKLPILPPIAPMLAKLARTIPSGDGWLYEPKWDGFRVLVFRDGDALYLQSRSKKPLLRYFPELEAPLLEALPPRCVVDGELVIAHGEQLDFERLQLRLHPAASRIARLAEETPAQVVLFDLLAVGEVDHRGTPFEMRRRLLEELLGEARAPVHLTPVTRDRAVAEDWFSRFEGAGLDGLVAKDAAGVYAEGKRTLVKVKHQRTADCVLAGFRWHKNGPGTEVGSLILGLYDADGRLHQLGIAASLAAKKRRALAETLAPLREDALDGHPWAAWASGEADGEAHARRPGVQSRWSQGKDLSWVPVRPERVVEVAYNQLSGGRLRHPAKLVRFRPDKTPEECRFDQLEVAPPAELGRLFELG